MGMSVGGSKRGMISEMNVVPLIDVLLVLLVIFMIIPHRRSMARGITASSRIPRPRCREPGFIVVQVLGDGTLSINQEPVQWRIFRVGSRKFSDAREPRRFRSGRHRYRVSGCGPGD